MIRPSPEILAVSRRWFDAIQRKRDNEVRNLVTGEDHMIFIGTDKDELWSGTAVHGGIADFFGSIPTIIRQDEVFGEAYENGQTGWACFAHIVVLPHEPDKEFYVRNTLILALEDGIWKIVHRHGSIPLPNEEFVGFKQTAIADLVLAAEEGFSLDQKTGFASIMFTDIVNSTRLAKMMGDRLWTSEVAEHFASLKKIIEDAKGQFVKSTGDGTLASFSQPMMAIDAALKIQKEIERSDGPDISLRIGIHSGSVVRNDEDFYGEVVNKAARITAIAGPGEIRVSNATFELVKDTGEFQFGGAASFRLDGFDGEHIVHSIERLA